MKLIFQKTIHEIDVFIAIAYNGELKIGSKWAWERKHMAAFNPRFGFYKLVSSIRNKPDGIPLDMDLHIKSIDGAVYCQIGTSVSQDNTEFSNLLLNPIEVSVLKKEQALKQEHEKFLDCV